ncbi:MmgE/PrpD family protein [Pseudooceanicola batsensis HTCC2597]|uniref:MmgE/PrpD family protein n=1 Tax=Pseudooceanicola batsensis (strain ATCC BAA-863 / DSM 15984 / KCTC 12145 / HTCC2597) TaxID=252305 RepID=A3TXK9_PSEBH|nr:MmgE/PrpD family protein [Pseudooceanicola batsensis]EAQ03569.1 MmgE/PrpD family protein [Pseudooceanicola batsensis HTCC2597]
MTLSQALAAFAAAPDPRIPDATARILRLSMLDWIACGCAGTDEPVARITRDMVMEEGGAAQASLFGGGRVPARAAALVNGATSHALDYDDTHFAHIGHPSVAVFPAALAIAEGEGLDGGQLRTAALIGMEASIRVGIWLGRGHYQVGFHQTATAGAFGAALAAGRLLGLEATALQAVLGLAGTRAAGLKSQFGTMGKPYNAGLAAATGVEAALLVAKGFEPAPQGLDGPQGFGETHHGAGDETALDGLGERWHFASVAHKFHACCHGLHAALEAVAGLLPIAPDRIDRIEVATHPRWMTVCNQPAPTTGLGAKFSYATVLPMAVLGVDTAKLESYTAALCARDDLAALRDRVRVIPDDGLTEMQARVRVVTDAGDREAFHDLDAPLPPDEKAAKVGAKAESLLGPRAAEARDLVEGGAPAREVGAFLRG